MLEVEANFTKFAEGGLYSLKYTSYIHLVAVTYRLKYYKHQKNCSPCRNNKKLIAKKRVNI